MLSERHEGRHPLNQPRLVRLIGLGFLVLSASAWLSASARSAAADPPDPDATLDKTSAQSGQQPSAEDAATASPEDVLKQAREQLADYYNQIESIRLVYTDHWTPSAAAEERARRAAEELRRNFEIDRRTSRYELLFTPLGQRLITTETSVHTDGSQEDETYSHHFIDGQLTYLSPSTKLANISTAPRGGITSRHPLQCLGLPIPGSERLRLTDLLTLSKIIHTQPEETIDGRRVTVLTIGPGIPEEHRARGWTAESWVKVWLARDLSFVPVRMVIHYLPDRPPYVMECRQFAPAASPLSEAAASFPRELVFADAGGTRTWTIEEVTVKPIVQVADVEPDIPADYNIIKDGEAEYSAKPEIGPPHDLKVEVVDVDEKPVSGASISIRTRARRASDLQPLITAETDESGAVVLQNVPGEDLVIMANHPELREARWILHRTINARRIILLPKTVVTVVDEAGQPVKDASLFSEVTASKTRRQLRPMDPRTAQLTDESGRGTMVTECTVRGLDQTIRVFALDEHGRAAMVAKPAKDLAEPITLILRPIRTVRATIEFSGKGPDVIPIHWADDGGRVLFGDSAQAVTDEANQQKYEVEFPLPLGSYQMIIKPTDQTDELVVPVEVPAGTGELELGSYSLQASQTKLLEGQAAPELAVSWQAGDQTQLANLRGKVVVLDFWGYWCAPCLEMMPLLMNLADEFKDEPVVWLAIHDASLANVSELEEHIARLENQWQRAFNLTVALDQPDPQQKAHGGVTCSRYAVRSWPTTIIIDQSGRVVGSVRKDEIEPTVRRLLGK